MQKALILPRPAGRAGAPKRFYLLGASESPLRQGFGLPPKTLVRRKSAAPPAAGHSRGIYTSICSTAA